LKSGWKQAEIRSHEHLHEFGPDFVVAYVQVIESRKLKPLLLHYLAFLLVSHLLKILRAINGAIV
jgi:hypothetical protein